jgi:hypothetical protein
VVRNSIPLFFSLQPPLFRNYPTENLRVFEREEDVDGEKNKEKKL